MVSGNKIKRKSPVGPRARKASGPETRAGNSDGALSTDASGTAGFPIVGIGASAGGLSAFEAFFSGMPTDKDPGMAFVLVQHLAPDHKSLLTDLIQRHTRMRVCEVEDGMEVRTNCAYIIPPNRDMAFLNGRLQLLEPSAPRGQRLPIDFFFRSLAQDQRERAICIVLSGTGNDGTQGLRAVKGEGGMAMAQDPGSTEHDGMPRSAIATGLVDYVLRPSEMPAQLIAYAAHAFNKPPRIGPDPALQCENAMEKIFVLLRSQTGHNFCQYKPSTIIRRIERRMAVRQIERIDEYVNYLQQTPAEVEALFRDLLIGVTRFFRNPEAFKALEQTVIPKLFAGKPAGAAVRVWVPGCSTGEEAYSIAILLQEHLETLKSGHRVQVFATDIDSRAIATARAGIYPSSVGPDISPERLTRFFTAERDGGAYRVNKGIRDLLIFSEQDVVKDPPFSKLDLVSCRNLLIYMGGELQKRLIPLFHYALNPGGILFLGNSETVGDFGMQFAVLDHKHKIYQYRETGRGLQHSVFDRFIPVACAPDSGSTRSSVKPSGLVKPPLRELAEQALLQQVAVAFVLVNSRGDILYLHGRTGMYLEPAPGEAGVSNILDMARDGLRRELTSALRKATLTKDIVRGMGLRVKTNSHFTLVNLTVRPVPCRPGLDLAASDQSARGDASTSDWDAPLYLVVLEEAPPAAPEKVLQPVNTEPAPEAEGAGRDAAASIEALKQELRDKEENLRFTNEELKAANEELKSANEEMQSVNEELQSTNEELETSKEELQSVNEELATVNAELQAKVTDLSCANNDMNNLLAGTGIGTVFVDHHLRILRFTPAATQIINMIPSDVGRPVAHVATNLIGYNRLVSDAQSVLDTLIPKEVDVQTQEGRWYTMRVQPYRTLENVIEGAVITFVEITEMKRAEAALRRLAVVVRDAYDAITVHDTEGHILAWNPGAERLYGWREAEALSMNLCDLIPERLREEAFSKVQQLCRADILEPYRTQRLAKDGRVVDVWLTTTALINESGQPYAIATTERVAGPHKELGGFV